ncbi:hypothetical protein CHARACLAT_012888 [Characodon lateralis]|uniref:Uncharacterized protein n=1 Tax=Characodon lateralis TaxID=208331 RepID=A0ABU7EIT7_9TELE|nr:hypothetical protein [Characodon lateralis]
MHLAHQYRAARRVYMWDTHTGSSACCCSSADTGSLAAIAYISEEEDGKYGDVILRSLSVCLSLFLSVVGHNVAFCGLSCIRDAVISAARAGLTLVSDNHGVLF